MGYIAFEATLLAAAVLLSDILATTATRDALVLNGEDGASLARASGWEPCGAAKCHVIKQGRHFFKLDAGDGEGPKSMPVSLSNCYIPDKDVNNTYVMPGGQLRADPDFRDENHFRFCHERCDASVGGYDTLFTHVSIWRKAFFVKTDLCRSEEPLPPKKFEEAEWS